MESGRIERLIEKYLEAETSLEEEKVLREYFSQSDVPVHLEQYKELFNYFTMSSFESLEKPISLPRKTYNLNWLSIAAIAILFVGIFSIYQKDLNEKEQARLAYVETQKALDLISFNLNKGSVAMSQLQTFEQAQNRIFKKK